MAGVTEELLKSKLEQKEKQLVEAASYGQQLLEENQRLLGQLEGLKKDNELLKQSYVNRRQQYEQNLSELEEMAIGQIAELEDEVKAKDLIIVELKQKLKKEMNTREDLVNSLNIEKLKIVELEHQMSDDQKKFNNLINEKEAEIAAVRDMLQEAERDKIIIKNELEKGKGVISSLMQEQDMLCKANVSISNELNSSEVTSKYWQDQHNQSSIHIKVLTEALNDKLATDSLTENDIIHHHHQSTTLADELEPYMTNHHHQQQLASSLACTKCLSMKDELLTLQSQYAELNQSLFKVVEQKYQLQLQLEEWQNDTEKLLQKLYVTKEEDTIN